MDTLEDIKHTRCAVCDQHPSTCINNIPVHLSGDDNWERYEIVERIQSQLRGDLVRATVMLHIPTCGRCYDQICNYILSIRGESHGYDFRDYNECEHPYHYGQAPAERVVISDVERTYGCPNPLCEKPVVGELADEDPNSQGAGVLVFENLLAQKFRVSVVA